MRVNEVMTPNPACCTRNTSLSDVARLMRDWDCGAIPVVDDADSGQELVGIITDRDIIVRGVADGADLSRLCAGDCMSLVVATVTPDMTLQDCEKIMEEHQVRRTPVVDGSGNCCGIVAQADLALRAPLNETADVVREVSKPGELPAL